MTSHLGREMARGNLEAAPVQPMTTAHSCRVLSGCTLGCLLHKRRDNLITHQQEVPLNIRGLKKEKA